MNADGVLVQLSEAAARLVELGAAHISEEFHLIDNATGYWLDPITTEPIDGAMTNEDLMKTVHLGHVPDVRPDFRFWTVARKTAFAKQGIEILEAKKDSAKAVGYLPAKGLCFVLLDGGSWAYIESGRIRGFVRTEDLITDRLAQPLLRLYQQKAGSGSVEDAAPRAKALVPESQNKAFAFLRATAGQTVVPKDCALSIYKKNPIREGADEDARVIGTLPQGGLCYVLADKNAPWVYVESGDVRGFVKRSTLLMNMTATVMAKGESSYKLAAERVQPAANKACYYTLTSVRPGTKYGSIREALVDYATQFVGNKYVLGGTSLTEGCDCSAFARAIYAEFGYKLPRYSRDQAECGLQIPINEAQPGDLIFNATDGKITHVVIYAGDGETVEAADETRGIIRGRVNTVRAVWACRILEDDADIQMNYRDIDETNVDPAMIGESMGRFRLTYFSPDASSLKEAAAFTATGDPLLQGRTVATDPDVIPYGTRIIINGHAFVAQDCGRPVSGNEIQIYMDDPDEAAHRFPAFREVNSPKNLKPQ